MLGRRKFLGTVGVVAGAVAAFGVLGKMGSSGIGQSSSLEDLLRAAGVHPQARFGTCRVVQVERTSDGSLGLTLADRAGQRFELELLGHDANAPGVAGAGSLAVYVKNQGHGTTATVEEHGLAAMALARHLARHEAGGARLPVLPTLSARRAGAGSARV
jgi:hypothetical protein